jgi:hypothetical protein
MGCLDWLDERGCLRTGDNVILYFMGDFSRARLWTGALKLTYLAPRLRELETTVVLVGDVADGDDGRLSAAAHLAEDLGLPYPLIADSQRTLWFRYASTSLESAGSRSGLVLVDGGGRPVRGWPLQSPEQKLDLPELLAAVEALGGQEPGKS